MDPEKVSEIKEWPSPRSMFEVRSLHGLVIFYRNFNSICAPILDTIKKENGSYSCTKEAEKGFRILKEKITKQSIMVLRNFRKTFQVRCDASRVQLEQY